MDMEQLRANAQAGDVNAMIELAKALIADDEIDEALDWSIKAAEAGSVRGMARAVVLHNFFARQLIYCKDWESAVTEATAARRWAAEILENRREKINDDMADLIARHLSNATYYIALACHLDDAADKQEGVRLLEGQPGTREKLLLAYLRLDADDPDWTIDAFMECLSDPDYAAAEKIDPEESLYATAAVVVSDHHTEQGDPAQAVAVLQECLTHVTCRAHTRLLQEMLAHYRQDADGAWLHDS